MLYFFNQIFFYSFLRSNLFKFWLSVWFTYRPYFKKFCYQFAKVKKKKRNSTDNRLVGWKSILNLRVIKDEQMRCLHTNMPVMMKEKCCELLKHQAFVLYTERWQSLNKAGYCLLANFIEVGTAYQVRCKQVL